MAEKDFKSRIVHKHDTEVNWNKATNFIPKQSELIIYDKDDNYDYERMKIGDGVTSVINLPFYGGSIENILDGTATGSVRTSMSTVESSEYSLGNSSFAEGNLTKAGGNFSHAEGYKSNASGAYSHAEGRETTASGSVSHAEGTSTVASGIRSHSSGYGTIANGENQTAIGKYNVQDDNNEFAFIIGNGTSTARSNAFTVDWNGNAKAGGEKLATETYVTTKMADIPTPDVSGQIEAHNTSSSAHSDIRQSISEKASASDLTTHTNDSTIHITAAERTSWNSKVSAESLLVKATAASDGTLSFNKTFEEIVSAIGLGKVVFLYYDSFLYPLYWADLESIAFGLCLTVEEEVASEMFIIDSTNSVSYMHEQSHITETFIANGTIISETAMTLDKTYDELLEAYNTGKSLYIKGKLGTDTIFCPFSALTSDNALCFSLASGNRIGQVIVSSTETTYSVMTVANANTLSSHIDNSTIHITADERTTWNAKASTDTATQTANGLMSSTDKKKLDELDYTVTVTETSPEGYVKGYNIVQESTGLNTTINIPKDMVVQSGTVETYELSGAWGLAGTYLVLTLANATDDKVYINVGNLIEYVTSGSTSDDQIQISIDDAHKVTASLKDGTISKAQLDSSVQASLDKADTAIQTVDSALSSTSTNPVQNKVINEVLVSKAEASDLTTHTSDSIVHITADERTAWNNKASSDLSNVDDDVFKAKIEASGFNGGAAIYMVTWEETD